MISVDFIERDTDRMLWRTELGAVPLTGDALVFPSGREVVVVGRIWRMEQDDRKNYVQVVVENPEED